MAVSKTWRGEGFHALTGTDEHRIRFAQRNLASTEKTLTEAAREVGKTISILQSHRQILQASSDAWPEVKEAMVTAMKRASEPSNGFSSERKIGGQSSDRSIK